MKAFGGGGDYPGSLIIYYQGNWAFNGPRKISKFLIYFGGKEVSWGKKGIY